MIRTFWGPFAAQQPLSGWRLYHCNPWFYTPVTDCCAAAPVPIAPRRCSSSQRVRGSQRCCPSSFPVPETDAHFPVTNNHSDCCLSESPSTTSNHYCPLLVILNHYFTTNTIHHGYLITINHHQPPLLTNQSHYQVIIIINHYPPWINYYYGHCNNGLAYSWSLVATINHG